MEVPMLDQATDGLYARARDQGQRGLIWSTLTRRSRCLLTLEEMDVAPVTQARQDIGVQMVPISRIRGSESRCADFDCDFNPLHDHNKRRWLNVASARQRGKTLPPVILVQVGDVYFVRDGHHRISVARALGQCDIEAHVLVWQVSGPLPWEMQTQATAHNNGGRAGIRNLFRAHHDSSSSNVLAAIK
jgi:hypothetical protein